MFSIDERMLFIKSKDKFLIAAVWEPFKNQEPGERAGIHTTNKFSDFPLFPSSPVTPHIFKKEKGEKELEGKKTVNYYNAENYSRYQVGFSWRAFCTQTIDIEKS